MAPKRYRDRGPISATMAQIPQKTERTHEENQERAYIAASRRTDRSIEARVQSARMASEIHKRRTGKALHISEAIVMGEEMYEEEEQEFPRSYRFWTLHVKTSSAEMNMRADAYPTNGVVSSQMKLDLEKNWRENEVNRAFAETFPNFHQALLRQWPSSGLLDPQPTRGDRFYVPQDSPFESSLQLTKYGGKLDTGAQRPSVLGMDADHQSPPPLTLTSESGSQPETPHSSEESVFENVPSLNSINHHTSNRSSFTTRVSLEANMLMVDNIGQDGKADPTLYCKPWMSTQVLPNTSNEMHTHIKMNEEQDIYRDSMNPMSWELITQLSNPMDDLDWDTFINDAVW